MSAFVNIPSPLATDVDMSTYKFSQPSVSVDFEDVPIEEIPNIEKKFEETIKKIITDGPEKFDMDRLETISKILLRAIFDQFLPSFTNLVVSSPTTGPASRHEPGEQPPPHHPGSHCTGHGLRTQPG